MNTKLVALQADKRTLSLTCPSCNDVREFGCKSKADAARFIAQYKRNGRGHYCNKPACKAAAHVEMMEVINSIVMVDALTGEAVS